MASGTSVVLDPTFQELLPSPDGYSGLQKWAITPVYDTLASRLEQLVQGGYVQDGIIDGYLALRIGDIAKSERRKVADLKVHVADAILVNYLRRNPRNATGMRPTSKSGYWVDKVR